MDAAIFISITVYVRYICDPEVVAVCCGAT